jgi:hypothetical protein
MRLLRWLLALALLSALVPLAVYAYFLGGDVSDKVEDWAGFATYISGTVAVLFSGIGIVALVQTLKIQQEQIAKLEGDALQKDFSEHFFGLLSTLSTILSETDIRSRKTGRQFAVGRDAYRHFFRKLRSIYLRRKKVAPDAQEMDLVRDSFDELYRRSGSDFGHYFRTLYRCVVLIEESSLREVDRSKYIDILTCRLSKFELALLMYNCLGTIGCRKFKDKVERLCLLEHLDLDVLIDPSHAQMFNESAFQQ